MGNVVRVTPANASEAASVLNVGAAVFAAPGAGQLVGATLKQFANQSFDGVGTLELDVNDVSSLAPGMAVRVLAETPSHTLNGLYTAIVESNAPLAAPANWWSFDSNTTITFGLPGGSATEGQRLLAIIGLADDPTIAHDRVVNSVPTGWTEIVNSYYPGSRARLYIYEHVVTATETVGPTFGLSETGELVAGLIECNGPRTIAPVIQTGENSTSFVCPAIQATYNGSLLLHIGFAHNARRYFTTPSPDAELFDFRATTYMGLVASWRAVNAGLQSSFTYTPSDTNGGAPVGDDYTAISIIIDGGGTTTAPAPDAGTDTGTAPTFWVGAHEHGAGTTKYNRVSDNLVDIGVARTHNVEALHKAVAVIGPTDIDHCAWWTGRANGLNVYDWQHFDKYCDHHKAYGRKLLLNFFGNPKWIRRNDYWDPYGASVSYVSQANRAAYREFVRDTVSRVISRCGRDFLLRVEAWNEPIGGEGTWVNTRHANMTHADMSQFLQAIDYTNTQGQTAIQQCVADLTKDIYQGTKAADSTVQVLGCASAYIGTAEVGKFMTAKTTEGEVVTNFCDGFSFHPYGHSDQIDPANTNGRSLSSRTNLIKTTLIPEGHRHKEIWATECAMPELWDMTKTSSVWWKNLYDNDKNQLAQRQYNWIGEFKTLGWAGVIVYSLDGGYNTDGTWGTGDHGSGYNFMGRVYDNPQIASAWTQAKRDFQK